ncbi:MAG: hypothetical protein ACJAZN_001034, partial [Planctomycetota bacterium]
TDAALRISRFRFSHRTVTWGDAFETELVLRLVLHEISWLAPKGHRGNLHRRAGTKPPLEEGFDHPTLVP